MDDTEPVAEKEGAELRLAQHWASSGEATDQAPVTEDGGFLVFQGEEGPVYIRPEEVLAFWGDSKGVAVHMGEKGHEHFKNDVESLKALLKEPAEPSWGERMADAFEASLAVKPFIELHATETGPCLVNPRHIARVVVCAGVTRIRWPGTTQFLPVTESYEAVRAALIKAGRAVLAPEVPDAAAWVREKLEGMGPEFRAGEADA